MASTLSLTATGDPMTNILDAKKLSCPPGSTIFQAAPIDRTGAPRTVGPFSMVTHVRMPVTPPGALPVDVDVRAHPHIGLTAISYVLDGAITHRDSLGNRQELVAGHLGATVSGRGVVHSERFERIRLLGGRLEMFQILLALHDGFEDVEPCFWHHVHDVPHASGSGAHVRWLLTAPPAAPVSIPSSSPILLADVTLDAGAAWSPPKAPERALYVHTGTLDVGPERATAGQVALLGSDEVVVSAVEPSRILAFGGTSTGPRFSWWNYQHSSLERIEAAKSDWREGRMTLPIGDTESFTPCPAADGRPLLRLNQA